MQNRKNNTTKKTSSNRDLKRKEVSKLQSSNRKKSKDTNIKAVHKSQRKKRPKVQSNNENVKNISTKKSKIDTSEKAKNSITKQYNTGAMPPNSRMTNKKKRATPTVRKKTEPLIQEEVAYTNKIDYVILLSVLLLLSVGLVMIYSASYYVAEVKFDNQYKFLIQQGVFASIGVCAMIIISNIDYNTWRNYFPSIAFIGSIIALILVLLVGEEYNGAKRWLQIGPASFQPSEVAKMATILMLASVISKKKEWTKTLGGHIKLFAILAIPVVLILIENLSTAVITFVIGTGMIFIASPFVWQFFALASTVIVGIVGMLYYSMVSGSGFRGARFEAWLDPFAFKQGVGWQTVQGLLSIGSGGLFGLGLGNSRQKYEYIPEGHNDIIFAIICEELGFFGATIIILLYVILFWRGIKVALSARDIFGTMLASGISIMIGFQAIMNIAVVTNTIPNTGIPLPLISYGGTSVFFTLCMIGILLNVSKYSRNEF